MKQAETLAADIQSDDTKIDVAALFSQLNVEAVSQFSDYLKGIENYRSHPYRRHMDPLPITWQEGNTCLHDYGSLVETLVSDRPILLIPSLINRSSILDLQEENSFIRYLSRHGYSCRLVTWNHPHDNEKQFALEHYILRLSRICRHLLDTTGKKPIAIGYCMGGTLATGLICVFAELVHALVALAAPWDFQADGGQQKAMLSPAFPVMEQQINSFGQLPTETLQLCFGLLDPMLSLKKFVKFARIDQQGQKAETFVALEDWLNDGVPLAGPTAKECLKDWYQENIPAKGDWRVQGKAVKPQHITHPSLCIIPATDRIVPPASAQALCDILPRNMTIKPALGHIGMMSGGRAKKLVWNPVLKFLKAVSA